jgi:hypothetical protein
MKKKMNFLFLMVPILAMADASTEEQQKNPLEFFVDGSFTYWYAKEDGLNLARSSVLLGSGTTELSSNEETMNQSFSYEPGFKVGLGLMSEEDWCLSMNYTYYRSKNTTRKDAPSNPNLTSGTGVWSVNDWFLQDSLLSKQHLSGTNLSSTWKLGMDLGDVVFSRPAINKKGFGVSPFGGLRTVWIRQNLDLYLTQAAASVGLSGDVPAQPISSDNTSHSWGIGPRLGTIGRYFLPCGFRLEGLLGISVLYTKFSSIKHSEQRASLLTPELVYKARVDNYNTVRPIAEANLGAGWEKRINEKYSFSLFSSYDFSYFWGQNAMRSMVDELSYGSYTGDNDLYFQGLTVTAIFCF